MKKLQGKWVYAVALVVLSGGWTLVSLLGWLDDAEQWSLNLRYKVRGPLESSAKVVYVNRDVSASNEFGRGWFPRDYYALAGEALFEVGEAKALFFDFVLTSDHLPKAEAPGLNYSGNLKMQRFLLRYPGRVILAAAYDGTLYPFSEHRSFLPDKLDGEWREDRNGWKGYSAEKNPLPALPEYPMWFPSIPHIDGASFPVAEIGLIDTSESLNRNNYVQWVPAHVRVSNTQPSLFLANGMMRWHNNVVELTGQGVPVKAISSEDVFEIVDGGGRRWNRIPSTMDLSFYTSALRLAEIGLGGVGWTERSDALILAGEEGDTLRTIPLWGGQHVAVNWFSGWRTQSAPENESVRNIASEKNDQWSFLGVARNLEEWCLEVESDREAAAAPFRSWAYPNDAYNPSVSIAEVLILYDAYLHAQERGYSKVIGLIEGLFEQFSDAYILVGPTDPLLQDMGPTPFDQSNTPRVAVHGNLLKTILDERYLHFAPWTFVPTLTFLVTFSILVSLSGFSSRKRWHWYIAPVAVLGFGAVGVVLFVLKDIVIPLVAPMSSGISATMFAIGWRLWQEESQRIRLRRLFGTYVSPDVVELMVEAEEDPKLGGNERSITAFFSDIASFTSISEQLSPADVVDLINAYVEEMTALLVREKGTLDKYIGDAIVGIFNAPHDLPDHAARACMTALAFCEAQQKLCRVWKSGNKQFPDVVCEMRTRIGLHTGLAVVGNMGSSQRFSYTMMGDSVNLAARLEQMGKVYGVDIIVSETTREEALAAEPEFVFRVLDVASVKGREASVRIYELIGMQSQLSDQQRRCVQFFEAGYRAFEERDLMTAKEHFISASKLEARAHEMNPSQLYLSRCKQMLDTLL